MQEAHHPRTRSKWTVLAIVGTGVFMCTLDSSLVNLSLQGIGSSLLMAVSPAMLTAAFAPNERGRARGFNVMTLLRGREHR